MRLVGSYDPLVPLPVFQAQTLVLQGYFLARDHFYICDKLSHGPTEKDEKKWVREKSRECHNHKPQPFPDTKRKWKQTKPNKRKSNKRTKSTKTNSLVSKRGNRNAKRTEKTQEQNNTRQDINRFVE